MSALPAGIVTFLLTDIEGSTALWEAFPDAMQEAVARHDALAASYVAAHEGVLVKSRGEGDSLFIVFDSAVRALDAAYAMQRAFLGELWPGGLTLSVRMALHSGEVQSRDQDYYGAVVNRAARLRGVGHGGQTLVSQSVADLAHDQLPSGASLKSLGVHRLRDLQHPERIYQLLHPDLPADFPQLRSLQSGAHNFPIQLTSFVGREQEVEAVKAIQASARLLTVTGSGGCGKTRLALQAAVELSDNYADGIWLVELASLHDPSLVEQTVRATLQLREEPGRTPMQTVLAYLESRELLLLLDNCEHLLDTCSQLIKTILLRCPKVKVIATSREPLGVPGEALRRVPSLVIPPVQETDFSHLVTCEAVRLFADRAAASNPAFALTEANAPAVAEICRRLDGIPLALELAAAKTRALTVQQIAQRLNDRFRLLTGGARTGLARHQTLQAAMDWSFDLLMPEEKTSLCRVSVFAGSWTLEAAEMVCSDPPAAETGGSSEVSSFAVRLEPDQILDLVCQLVDKSLITTESNAEMEQRYLLSETVRQYSREQLIRTGHAVQTQTRHRNHFLSQALEAETHLYGTSAVEWLFRLDRDLDNFRIALDWCRFSPRDAEIGLRLSVALWRFWMLRGYYREGSEHILCFLDGETMPPALASRACYALAHLAADSGDLMASADWARQSLEWARKSGDRSLEAGALTMAGCAHHFQGAVEGLELLEAGLTIAREAGNVPILTEALMTSGFCRIVPGESEIAVRLLSEATPLAQRVGDPMTLGELNFSLGLLAAQSGNEEEATARFTASLEHWGRVGYERGVAIARDNLARRLLICGKPDEASPLLHESLRLRARQSNTVGIASALEGCASLAFARSESERAVRLFGFAEQLRAVRRLPRPTGHDAYVQRDMQQLQTRLGDAVLERERQTGQSMMLEQALAEALALFA